MKKILLVCPALLEDMPYLSHYLDFLDSSKIEYDVVFLSNNNERRNYISYNCFSSTKQSTLTKLLGYYKYSRFVIKKLSQGNYTHVVTMGIASSLFLCNYLKKKFREKYIYDIRDYSHVLDIPVFKNLNKVLLKYSYMNVISSGGFKSWLPKDVEYTMCHNTTLDSIDKGVISFFTEDFSGSIKILTIGQIRDLEVNTYVIEQLGQNSQFELRFSGKGATLETLAEFVKERGYTNVKFTGRYKKEEEDSIVEKSTFINVCMGSNMVSDYLLSNRLYLAARLKKPLISFDGCYQAEIIRKYSLGVIVNRTDNISEKITDYIASFNSKQFVEGCKRFLEDIRIDLQTFSSKMQVFTSD